MPAVTPRWLNLACLCTLAGCSAAWMGAAQAHAPANPWPAASVPGASVPGASGTRALPRSTDAAARPLLAWPIADDNELDAVRGGFDLGDGLLASFGFERQVYINGNLVSSTSVNLPDVARMTPDQAATLAALGTVDVIQNGAGNRFDPSVLDQSTAATVIQNSLDNQSLQSLTTINAAVNSLDSFRSRNLQDSLQAGLIGSLGQ